MGTGCASHYQRVSGQSVRLYLKASKTDDVFFCSSLDGFVLHPARRVDDTRVWEIAVPADAEFTYFYVVNGKVYLPSCRFKEQDDFGSQNCIFTPDM